MKISCSQEDFYSAINIVSKAVATRSTVSIAECILITAYGDEIKLTANNNELGIETIMAGNIEEEGMIAIDAKIFAEIIRSLPSSNIVMTTNEKYSVNIVCDQSEFNIMGRPGDDFSFLPDLNQENAVEIPQLALKDIIRQTIFSTDETKPVMRGEQFVIDGNTFQVESIDGYRFSIRKITLNDDYGDKKAIVPAKTLNELTKILRDDMDEFVQIVFSNNHMVFLFDTTTVVTRLIEGEFPDINRMMMADYETKFTVSKKKMTDSLRRASLLSREGDKKPIALNIKDDVLHIDLKTHVGTMDEDIDIKKEGKNLKIGFNPGYLLDVFNVVDDEEVDIYMGSSRYPCYINNAEKTYNYMILPVNI